MQISRLGQGRWQGSRCGAAALALTLVCAASLGCKKSAEAPATSAPVPAGGGKPAGAYRFAFVTNNSSDFWNIAEKGVRKAEMDLGIKAVVMRPLKTEVSEQQRFIEDILVQGFDGMAIAPISPDPMTPLLDRVAEKMPVVCHDGDAAKSKRKVYVGTNNVEAGHAAGAAAIKALKAAGISKGKVAIFVGRIEMQNAIDRKQGVDETLGKQPGIEILPIFLDHADRSKAKKNVEDALARYPDLVLTIGLWSYNGPCMLDAVRASTRASKPVIVAFDEEEETLKGVQDGLISATIVQRPFQFGYQSMKALKDIKDGKTPPATIDTGITTVTRENLTQFWNELRELKK
ncbi:MAG TPA: substrate-binding domain-containing protein [Polyangia bacterium]|nr:substrate-binding domain-containing protein [Polyangia bacterium]